MHLVTIFSADIAWWLLVAVMLVRPLNDVFRNQGTRKLCKYRKFLGIGAGVMAIIHVVSYVYDSAVGIDFWFGYGWNFGSLFGWGILALLFIIPPLLTSSVWAQKIFKRYWKNIQSLSYPAFICTAVHVSFIDGWWWYGTVAIFLWVLFWFVARFSRRKEWDKTNFNNNEC